MDEDEDLLEEMLDDGDLCPECGAETVGGGALGLDGVKCPECDWWFCY